MVGRVERVFGIGIGVNLVDNENRFWERAGFHKAHTHTHTHSSATQYQRGVGCADRLRLRISRLNATQCDCAIVQERVEPENDLPDS